MNQPKSIRIVVIGGGNGTAVSLRACKIFTKDILLSAVVSMFDTGGANGRLRKETGMLPTSDLMRTTLALSDLDFYTLKQVFYVNRIVHVNALVDQYYIGILWYSLLQERGLTLIQAQETFEQIVGASGHVHPVTLELSNLYVELSNGDILIGEGYIDRPLNRDNRIIKAWLEPACILSKGAQSTIEDSDVIILGPGSLYCSIIPNILVKGMLDALLKSKAKLIYVVGNAYETIGEAGPEKLCDFITELEQYLPRKLDAVVFNDHILTEQERQKYAEKEWSIIEYTQNDLSDKRIFMGDYERTGGGLDHEKLGTILQNIIF